VDGRAGEDTTGAGNIWVGRKTEVVMIRMTPAEKQEIAKAAENKGGLGISRYLLNLHHRTAGRAV
jgi:hypothetical protein